MAAPSALAAPPRPAPSKPPEPAKPAPQAKPPEPAKPAPYPKPPAPAKDEAPADVSDYASDEPPITADDLPPAEAPKPPRVAGSSSTRIPRAAALEGTARGTPSSSRVPRAEQPEAPETPRVAGTSSTRIPRATALDGTARGTTTTSTPRGGMPIEPAPEHATAYAAYAADGPATSAPPRVAGSSSSRIDRASALGGPSRTPSGRFSPPPVEPSRTPSGRFSPPPAVPAPLPATEPPKTASGRFLAALVQAVDSVVPEAARGTGRIDRSPDFMMKGAEHGPQADLGERLSTLFGDERNRDIAIAVVFLIIMLIGVRYEMRVWSASQAIEKRVYGMLCDDFKADIVKQLEDKGIASGVQQDEIQLLMTPQAKGLTCDVTVKSPSAGLYVFYEGPSEVDQVRGERCGFKMTGNRAGERWSLPVWRPVVRWLLIVTGLVVGSIFGVKALTAGH